MEAAIKNNGNTMSQHAQPSMAKASVITKKIRIGIHGVKIR